MNREAIDLWLERSILALVLGVLVFGVLALGGVRPSEFIVLWWLILGALALWSFRIWLAPKFRFLWPPLCWAALPFVGYAIWRYRTAEIEFVARQELIQVILAALLLLIIVNNLYSQESSRVLAYTLVFLGMVVAMYGVFQWLRSTDSVWGFPRPESYRGRASGSFICPNHLAGFLEMVLPLGIALAVSGRMGPVLRVFLVYASLMIIAGIVGSLSRAAWFGSAAGLFVLFLFMVRTRGQRWIALGLVVFISAAGYWLYSRTVGTRVQGTELKGHGREIRLRLWESGLEIWKTRLWQGIGADHFDYYYGQHREAADRTQGRPGRVHNDYLNTAVDYGLIGLLLALLPLAVASWCVARCWPYVQRTGTDFGQKRSNRAALVLGATAGLTSLLVHSFFDFNMHIPSNAFVAMALLGLIGAHMRFASEGYWITARWPTAVAATLILWGALYCLAPAALKRTHEVALLRKAEKLPNGSAQKIDLMRQACAQDPKNFENAFAVGEQLRTLAFTGEDGSDKNAEEAAIWFRRVVALNPRHVNGHM